MKTKRYISVCLILLITGLPGFSEQIIVFGGTQGWSDTLAEGLMETHGWRGNSALTLAPVGRNPFERQTDESTRHIDLLLLSETGGLQKLSGNYRIEGNYDVSTQFSARGDTSLRPGDGGIRLYPQPSSLWWPGSEWGNFTLEFRLRPTRLTDGEVFLRWEGRDADGRVQHVSAKIEKRRMLWEFTGFFQAGSRRTLTLILSSTPLLPGEWHHHRIRFHYDASSSGRSGSSPGLLEYLIDGVPVDMVHATVNGNEGGEIFSPAVGVNSDKPLHIAPSFSGYIDEFQLLSMAQMRPPAGHYVDQGIFRRGVGRTKAVDTGYPGSVLKRVRARFDAPGDSRIRFFFRALSSEESRTSVGFPHADDSRWLELEMTAQPEDPSGSGRWYSWTGQTPVSGRSLLLSYIMEPDPAADTAPVLSVLEMKYVPRLPPSPPRDFSGDEENRVFWNPEVEADIAGWWIFWGLKPGDYNAMAWIPRMAAEAERPQFSLPVPSTDQLIYTSLRAAWAEGGPDGSDPPYPMDYRALSAPSREIILH